MIVVDVLSGHHRVRTRHRVAGAECTVGRSAACDIVLDDPFVAPIHARIRVDDEGNVEVADLESRNGVEAGGRVRHGGEPVRAPDGVFRVGRTRLRVRTPREVVGPERVDRGGGSWFSRGAELQAFAVGFAVSIGATAFEVWTTTTQPRELSTALVTTILALLALMGLWISLWALASRAAFGESRWVRHAVIVSVLYAVFAAVARAVDVANGALALHLPAAVGPVLVGIAVSIGLSAHLMTASPMRVRFAVGIGVAIPAVVIAAMLWTQARGQNRSPTYIADLDQVVPPALLLRRGASVDGFATELADLRSRADANRAFVEREDPSPDEDDADPD